MSRGLKDDIKIIYMLNNASTLINKSNRYFFGEN